MIDTSQNRVSKPLQDLQYLKTKQKIVLYSLIATMLSIIGLIYMNPYRNGHHVFMFYATGVALVIHYFTILKFPLFADGVVVFLTTVVLAIAYYLYNDIFMVLGGWVYVIPSIMLSLTQNFGYFIISVVFSMITTILFIPVIKEHHNILETSDGVMHLTTQVMFNCFATSLMNYYYYRELQKSAQDALKSKGEAEKSALQLKSFIESFSHELRNPLNSLRGNIDLALDEQQVPPKIMEYLTTSKSCTEILLQLINNILDSGKSDIGTLEIDPKPTDLWSLVSSVWNIFASNIASKRLNGYVKVNKNVPLRLILDQTRISQVLMNLLSNALKFTKSGSISLQIDWIAGANSISDEMFTAEPTNRRHTAQDQPNNDQEIADEPATVFGDIQRTIKDQMIGDYETLTFQKKKFVSPQKIQASQRRSGEQSANGILRINVHDTGSGMSSDSLRKLFNKFAQFGADSQSRTIGTGLGLFITKEIVNKSGGDIRAFSKLGNGSTFVACIPTTQRPLSELGVSKELTQSMIERTSRNEFKFLIAEDSHYNVNLFKNYVEKINGKVVSCYLNGPQVLYSMKNWNASVCQSQQISSIADVLIADLDMPLMNGISIARSVRKYENSKGLKRMKIIVVCGRELSRDAKDKLQQEGIVDKLLVKPVSLVDFVQALDDN